MDVLDDDYIGVHWLGPIRHHVCIYDYEDPSELYACCDCTDISLDCEHIWAAVLLAEQKLGEAPFAGKRLAVAEERDPAVSSSPLDWQRRLRALQPLAGERPPAPLLDYFVSPPPWSGPSARISVQIAARPWRKREREHGAPRLDAILMEDLVRLPEADRMLLSIYDPQVNYNTYRWDRKKLSINNEWLVPTGVLPVVLHLLSRASRVWCGPLMSVTKARALQIDVAQPFRLQVRRDGGSAALPEQKIANESPATAGTVSYIGELRRGDDVVPLGELAGCSDTAIQDGLLMLWDQARIVSIDLGGAIELTRELLTGGAIQVPEAQASEALLQLAAIPGANQFLAGELTQLPVGEPMGVVAIQVPKDGSAPITAELQFDYDGSVVAGDMMGPPLVGRTQPSRRNEDAERTLAEVVATAGLVGKPARMYCERSQLGHVVSKLVAAGVRVLARGKPVRSFVSASNRVTTGIDWFEIYADVAFDDYQAGLPELLRRKVTPEGFVELGDGSFGMLPLTWMRRIEALRLMGAKPDEELEHLRLPSSQALLLDAMLTAQDDDVRVDRKFQALRRRLAGFERVEPVHPPTGFAGELRPYQKQGLGWLAFLREFGLGGCLADDMGLGKTVQVLAHLWSWYGNRRKKHGPSLLVAPRSVVSNWLQEAARFTPKLRVLDFSQPDRWRMHGLRLASYDLLLTTYALIRTDAVMFAENEQRFACVILDEAQAIKNADSQTAKAVRLLRGEQRLALTGTPVENHLGELWSQFEFLNPGMLGRLPAFRALFASDTNQDGLSRNRELIQRALRPVLLRRTKQEVLPDLPAKIEQVLWCDLDPAQRRSYEQLRNHYRKVLLTSGSEADGKQNFLALEALLRLRQAACHEGLLNPRHAGRGSGKFDVLLPRLAELAEEGHKVLVFSQFVSLLDLLAPQLSQLGITFERLDGRTRNRQEKVDAFQDSPDCSVFLISLKAGGTGLNLTAADYVFLLDPWWNPAVEQQAIDRAHRIGQKQTVNAYRMACRGTVEERVLELQEGKRRLAEAVLGNERSLLQDLTREDLDLLLS